MFLFAQLNYSDKRAILRFVLDRLPRFSADAIKEELRTERGNRRCYKKLQRAHKIHCFISLLH